MTAEKNILKPRRRWFRKLLLGCVLFPFVFLVVAWATLGWLVSGPVFSERAFSLDSAMQVQEKVERIAQFYNPSVLFGQDRLKTTRITEEELDSYVGLMRKQLQSPYQEAIERTSIQLEDGQFAVQAFLRLGHLGNMSLLPWPFNLDTLVKIKGKLETVDGKGQVMIDTVELGAIQIPGETALEWLVQLHPKSHATVQLLKGFPLPFGAKSIEVQKGQIRLQTEHE